MTEPRDEIGAWLGAPVEPLPPPQGTFERIRRKARRRRRNQAIAVAATAAAVVAGLVAAPRLATTFFPSGRGQPVAAGGQQVRPSAHVSGLKNKLSSGPTAMGTGQPLPNGFEAGSASFVGLDTGWVLGTLSAPCAASGCLALARTDDTGATWYRVPAPQTGTATASTGVSQVRFLNRVDGWIFGPELWWTSDGGQHWQQVDTGGRRVVSLEAVADRAFAVFASCPVSRPLIPNGGAGDCLSYQLYSAVAGTSAWQPVPGAADGAGTGTVVLGHSTGYLLGVKGSTVTLSSGPVSGGGAWTAVTGPCLPGGAGTGAPVPAPPVLATAAADSLFAVCTAPSAAAGQTTPVKKIETSSDGGRTWHVSGTAPIPGSANSVAAAPGGGMLVIATSTGLYVSGDGGASWQLALTGPPGGFGYVGMTDVLQGFAIPVVPGQQGILFTRDGGTSWRWYTVPRSS